MKASDVRRGYLQIKIVRLPLAGVPAADLFAEQAPKADHDGALVAPIAVGLRPLSPGQEAEIFARAREYAIAKAQGAGGATYAPAEDDEVYNYGKALHRCLLGVVDPDSDPSDPEPFFDGGLSQLEGMAELGADGVLTLARMHSAYQDEISGLVREVQSADGPQFRALLKELSGPLAMDRYFSLRPGIAASFTLTSARLLWTLLQDRSYGGSDAEPSTTRSSGAAGAAPKRTRRAGR